MYFHSFQRTEKSIFEATPEILAWFGPHWPFFPNVLVRRRIGENTDMALTDEDKEWIGTQLRQVETGLRGEIGRVETGLRSHIERVETGLRSQIERVESGLKAEIERVETNLLTAFHKWASPMEMRLRSHSAMMRVLDMEIESLQDRVKKLEPPTA